MPGELWYAALSDIPTDLVVSFKSTIDIPMTGSQVIVDAPPQIKLSCDDAKTPEEELRMLTLPPLWSNLSVYPKPCEVDIYTGRLSLRLNGSLPIGDYIFTVRIHTPIIDPPPADNRWSLLLRDVDGHVVDTIVDYPGPRITYGLRASAHPL